MPTLLPLNGGSRKAHDGFLVLLRARVYMYRDVILDIKHTRSQSHLGFSMHLSVVHGYVRVCMFVYASWESVPYPGCPSACLWPCPCTAQCRFPEIFAACQQKPHHMNPALFGAWCVCVWMNKNVGYFEGCRHIYVVWMRPCVWNSVHVRKHAPREKLSFISSPLTKNTPSCLYVRGEDFGLLEENSPSSPSTCMCMICMYINASCKHLLTCCRHTHTHTHTHITHKTADFSLPILILR
jgi:hypothetical protein